MDSSLAFTFGRAAVRFKFFERWMHGSSELADDFIQCGIDDWAAEGHFSPDEADALRAALGTPEVAAVTANLGAHLAMSVPLRFPLGSLARFVWTLVARVRSQWPAIRGNQEAREECSIHTVPVMLLALVPGFGAGAYLLSKPLRSNPALAAIILDRLLRKLPARLYERLHFIEFTTWLSRPDREVTRAKPASRWRRLQRRLGIIAVYRWLVVVVLLANASIYAAAQSVHLASGSFGLVDSAAAGQFLVAGLLGMLAFRLFWQRGLSKATLQARAGIFLWGAMGLGVLLFGIDSFFNLSHEVGEWFEHHANYVPLANKMGELATITYALLGITMLAAFRVELFTPRASNTLFVAGMLAAAAMLGTDFLDEGIAGDVFLAVQLAASAALLLAFLVRYLEIHASGRKAAAEERPLLVEPDQS